MASEWWPSGLVVRRHPEMPREAMIALGISGTGLIIGYLAVNQHLPSAVALAVLPLLLWLLYRPRLAVVLLALSIPFPISLLGGGAGLNVAASDILLSLIFVAAIARILTSGRTDAAVALKPLVPALFPYLAWMVVLIGAHLDVITLLQSGQRLELFLFPVVIGVVIALRGFELPVLKVYVLTATVFAALYPIFSNAAGGLGAQKNPAGQYIANALLLIFAVKELRGRILLAVPILTLGLFWTESRGAILSVVVGMATLLVMNPGRERLRFLALLIPVAAIAAIAFALLPSAAQQRNTNFDVGTQSRAAYSLQIRETFRKEAWSIIHAEPVFGTGIGRYLDGADGMHPTTTDPHEVLLFQAAEGGYPLAVAFGVLVLGSAAVLAHRGRHLPLGPAAVALLLATVGHGLVDVYWVRGTPVLSWLLVGIAVGQIHLKKHEGPTAEKHTSRHLSGAVA